jgi:SET domain-containing protein
MQSSNVRARLVDNTYHNLPRLVVQNTSDRGRGVVTLDDISEDQIIEISPVLAFPRTEYEILEKTSLYNYLFEWPADASGGALALAFGSLFNHSATKRNVFQEFNFDQACITFAAVRDIKAGEELLIDYGFVWFEEK